MSQAWLFSAAAARPFQHVVCVVHVSMCCEMMIWWFGVREVHHALRVCPVVVLMCVVGKAPESYRYLSQAQQLGQTWCVQFSFQLEDYYISPQERLLYTEVKIKL